MVLRKHECFYSGSCMICWLERDRVQVILEDVFVQGRSQDFKRGQSGQ